MISKMFSNHDTKRSRVVRHRRASVRLAMPLALLVLASLLLPPRARAQYSENEAQQSLPRAENYAADQQRTEPIAIRNLILNANLDPETHQIKAKAQIRFVALQDTNEADFELNENLFPTNVTAADGRALSAQRSPDNLTIEIGLEKPLAKGQTSTITFEYAGTLANADHSPVEGIQLAYIGEKDSYLLYPGRWFPLTGYSVDRYTAQLHITVPDGFTVVSGGEPQAPVASGDNAVYSFNFTKPEFPGSIAVIPRQALAVNADGLTMKVYFSAAHQAMAQAYGEAAAKMVNFYSSKFGPPPVANLSLVEIDDHSLGGYSGPEVIFLAPRGIGAQVNVQLLAQEVAQQWWRGLVSPASKADLWIDHGMATYSAALYLEHIRGEAALTDRVRQMSIDALTADTVPIEAAGRLPDFSPQFHAIMYDKAAVVLHMLRWVIGDQHFFQTLNAFANQYAFRSATTDDFQKVAAKISSQKLGPFFIEWMESTGASDFKADYTVYRISEGGYKVVGKIHQDMDTFSMPVEVKVETAGKSVTERVQVTGRASPFSISTTDFPKKIIVDPNNRVLKFNDKIRVEVYVARGEQLVQQHDYQSALEQFQKALDINRTSSLAHFRVGEAFFQLRNYQSAANSFRDALNGNLIPKWTEVWSHLYLGKIFDVTGQRDRAVNEYQQALRTQDNTQGALAQARQFLKKPYQRSSREIQNAENTSPATPPAAAAPAATAPAAAASSATSSGSESQSSDDRPKLRRRLL